MFCLLNTDVHTSSFIYIFIGTQLILLFFSKIKKKKKKPNEMYKHLGHG